MGKQTSTKYTGRQLALVAGVVCVSAALVATAYHCVSHHQITVRGFMDKYTRNPIITIETYYRFIDFWAGEGTAIFQLTCPTRYEKDIVAYCATRGFSCLLGKPEQSLYLEQTTLFIKKPLVAEA